MTLDPFRPDDAGDASATPITREQRRPAVTLVLLACAGLVLLVTAALVVVFIA